MKAHLLSALLCILTLLTSWPAAAEPVDVSMVQLIATPEKFHGKFVRVIGYLRLEFEGTGLYLHQEDYRAAISKNGIWFKTSEETLRKRKELSDQYVLVEGTFDAEYQGHLGMWSGAITDVKRVMPWKFARETKPKK